MSINAYTTGVIYLYIGLFLFSILIGIVEIWNRIWKKKPKYWGGLLPCSFLYLFFAMITTFVAFIAYDDLSDPNYARYGNWTLRDFILHDIKTLLIYGMV